MTILSGDGDQRLAGRGAAAAGPPADAERLIVFDVPVHLRLTLGLHLRGPGDPTWRFEADGRVWHATRTTAGPATILLAPASNGLLAHAWGPGAGPAIESVAPLIGLEDEPSALVPRHSMVEDAARRLRGLRIGRTGAVLAALVPAILEQKVTGAEARHAYRAMIRRHGESAPGPAGLRLQPSAATLAALPYHGYHPLGVERRRAELIRAVAREAPRLERLAAEDTGPGRHPARLYEALRSFAGIGPWTAAEVGIRALGDPDAVSVGDFHLPNLVAWALAHQPRGTDERMLELLEPYRGQRGRVLRLLELSGIRAPRYGPRLPGRRIDRI